MVSCTATCFTLLILSFSFGTYSANLLAKPGSTKELYRSIPSTKIANWDQTLLTRKFLDKITPLNEAAKGYNEAFNNLDGYLEKPVPADLDPALKLELAQQWEQLPLALRNFFNRHVIGIYTAEGVGSSAMAGSVYETDNANLAAFGFLIIDVKKINQTLNQWATYKENTVFEPVTGYQLKVQLEHEAEDSKAAALRYLLIHEIGHIFHAVLGLQPSYMHNDGSRFWLRQYAFNLPEIELEVQKGEGYYTLYAPLSYYRKKPPFDLEDAVQVYNWLQTTTRASLYGATDYFEDFAETFALLIHTKYLKKPYQVTVTKGSETLVSLGSRLDEPALATKVQIIEQYLKNFE